MDDYADIYFIDENRNAVTTHDHRTGGSGGSRPASIRVQSAQPVRTVYMGPQGQGRPMVYGGSPPVIYAQPPQSTAGRLLGQLTTGQVVEIVAQAFAALQSLPAAPVATKDTATDVGNLILFQNALAQHAKRDEQVRTLGALVARLVG